MIRSHVYLAKSILNRFSYRDKDNKMMVYFIDFKRNVIDKDTTASFNRYLGYFTDENEKKLKRFSEEKIGNIIAELKSKYKEYGINFKISPKTKKIIKKYVCYQLIRDDTMAEYIKEFFSNINCKKYYLSNENLIKLYGLKEYYSNISINKLKNRLIDIEEEMDTFFESMTNLGILIRFNSTNRKFVLTSSTTALNPYSKGYFMINITLTPEISITLCNKKTLKDVLEISDDFYIAEIKDEQVVLQYNKELYETAKKNNPHIIVGYRKELEELI